MRRHFQELVTMYQDRVYRLARYSVGNREEAEDITQEVLVRLWRHLDRVEPAAVWPWLVRVTRNAAIDALRGKLRHNYDVAANFSLRRITQAQACGYYTLHAKS